MTADVIPRSFLISGGAWTQRVVRGEIRRIAGWVTQRQETTGEPQIDALAEAGTGTPFRGSARNVVPGAGAPEIENQVERRTGNDGFAEHVEAPDLKR